MDGGYLAGLFALIGVFSCDLAEGTVLVASDGVERAALQRSNNDVLVLTVHRHIHRVLAADVDGVHVLERVVWQNAVAGNLGEIAVDTVEVLPFVVQRLEGRIRLRFQTLQALPAAVRQDLVGLEALAAGISLFCRPASYISIMHDFFLLFDSLCLLVAGRSSVTP